jgi:hypothetical protein
MRNHLAQRTVSVIALFCFCLLASVALGAEKALLTVGQSGAYLYSQQDEESTPTAKLVSGETLLQLAEAVGQQTWYMVRTQQGLIGWVRRADVVTTAEVQEAFKEQVPPAASSTWSVRTNNGRGFEGTWSIDATSSDSAVSGTWTLSDPAGQAPLRGIWSAEKFSTGWRGVWRAQIDGKGGEYGGTWTADFAAPIDGRLTKLFEAAAKDVVRGVWTAGPHSGSWALRAAKPSVREDSFPYPTTPVFP